MVRQAYISRVDGQAVILVGNINVLNVDSITGANVECVSVVGTSDVITSRVVELKVFNGYVASQYTEQLHRRVDDVEAGNDGVVQAVSIEELRLRYTSVAT